MTAEHTYLLKAEDIAAMDGVAKTHFQNPNAKRINKSLGDATGLTGLGIHLIEVEPRHQTTEFHVHYQEDEAVYILAGTGEAEIGKDRVSIKAGDFLGYRKNGLAHTIHNTGTTVLQCLVIGQRLEIDIADYPRKAQRIYRSKGMPWDLVDHDEITHPDAGPKK
ncbi:cupin domain-containing protein [Rhodobacteraceae bacterium]|nr:cupin domain-containing protein [Paracoccaceae bacterium]